MSERTVTLEDFIKALELNGYPQSRGRMIRESFMEGGYGVDSACAFGQAALNLGASVVSLEYAIGRGIVNRIIDENDSHGFSCEKIAKNMREKLNLNKEITFKTHNYKSYRNYQGVKV